MEEFYFTGDKLLLSAYSFIMAANDFYWLLVLETTLLLYFDGVPSLVVSPAPDTLLAGMKSLLFLPIMGPRICNCYSSLAMMPVDLNFVVTSTAVKPGFSE